MIEQNLLLSQQHLPEVYSARHVKEEEDARKRAKKRGGDSGPATLKKPRSSPREIASHIDPCSPHLMDTEGGIAGGNWEIAMRVTRSH